MIDEAGPIDGARCLVTGGAGYVGRRLVDALLLRGCRVRVLDRVPAGGGRDTVESIVGDVTNPSDLARAVEGVDVVFHTVARILLLRYARPEEVRSMHAINVEGTRRVVEASIAAGVTRLVHTSSTGVVLGPNTSGGDESLPYSTVPDLYTQTKIEAEKIALEADGRNGIRIAAIRPGGIYGPGERHMLMRPLLQSIAQGKPVIRFGTVPSRLDYTYIDNVVDGQLRAADRLVPGSPVPGHAYFITDEEPMNHAEFSHRLLLRMGVEHERRTIPTPVIRALAWSLEKAHAHLGAPDPAVTLTQVDTCVYDAYYSTARARRDLGYRPLVGTTEGIDRCVPDALSLYRSFLHGAPSESPAA